MPVRNYTYYDFTLSLCPTCLKRVDAKIVFENDKVYMLKNCIEHGKSKVLIADDIDYYKRIRNYNKPFEIFSTGISTDGASEKLHHILCCLPNIEAPNLSYDNLFRIIVMQFVDAYNFDVRAIKKSCVHIVDKDYKIIPFETMNLFYRDDKKAYLKELQNL